MNILPIGVINSYRSVNFNQKNAASNIFLKNIGVDTVSFSGNGTDQTEQKYKPETRKAKLCEAGYNSLDIKTASVLNKLDSRTNQFIKKANKINEEAQKLQQTAQRAYNSGNINIVNDTSSELSARHIQFVLPFNKAELHVSYDTKADKVESISKFENNKAVCSYFYNSETGELRKYSTANNEEVMEFSDKRIDISHRSLIKETDFCIRYSLKDISYVGIEDRFYDISSDPNHRNPIRVENIAKSAVCPEHDCQVAYALTESWKYPSDSSAKEKHFMKWVSYED